MTLFKLIQSDCTEAGTGYHIRCVMEEMLRKTLEITRQTHLRFDTYFHCNFGIDSAKPHKTAETIKNLKGNEKLPCNCSDKNHYYFTRNDYDVWFVKPTDMQVL